jgi:hypothetical protein
MLRRAFCLLLALTGVASAQPKATLDVELPADTGKPSPYAEGRSLSVGPEGSIAIVTDKTGVILDRRGRPKARLTLPNAEQRKLLFVCTAFVAEDDIAVVYQYAENQPKSGLALFRFARDGRLKRESHIAPLAGQDKTSIYDITQCTATRDAALQFTGGYGPGPYAWWLGKYTLEGRRVFHAGPGTGGPERVAAMISRKTGHWWALVLERPSGGTAVQWHLHHYLDGKLVTRKPVEAPGEFAAGMLVEGGVIASSGGKLSFVNDDAKITRQAPWPYFSTWQIVPAHDGFWATVNDAERQPAYIVRVNAAGAIRWRSENMDVLSIARVSENEIAAVVQKTGESKLRLMRFDDRAGLGDLP